MDHTRKRDSSLIAVSQVAYLELLLGVAARAHGVHASDLRFNPGKI